MNAWLYHKGVGYKMKKITLLVLPVYFLLLSLPLFACQPDSSVKISVGGVIAESEVFCRHIILDDSWTIMAGSLTGFLDTPPNPRKKTAIFPAMPMPAKYNVYWGNRHTGMVFRAEVYAPKFVAKAEEVVRQHGAAGFEKELIIVLRDSGEVQVWLKVKDELDYEQRFTEFIGSFQSVSSPIGEQNGTGKPNESRQLSTPAPEKGA